MNPTPTAIGIKETREFIKAAASVYLRFLKNNADGKHSYLELASYVGDLGDIRAGLDGFMQIYAELKDLGTAEAITVRNDIKELVVAAGFRHRASDRVGMILDWLYYSAKSTSDFVNLPPSAVLAES